MSFSERAHQPSRTDLPDSGCQVHGIPRGGRAFRILQDLRCTDAGSTGVRPGRGDSRLMRRVLDGPAMGGSHYHCVFTRGSERHAGSWATSRSLLLTKCPADTLPHNPCTLLRNGCTPLRNLCTVPRQPLHPWKETYLRTAQGRRMYANARKKILAFSETEDDRINNQV